jgi:hypothetical protein
MRSDDSPIVALEPPPASIAAVRPPDMRQRLQVLGLFLILYLAPVFLGLIPALGHQNANGIADIGQYYVPSLVDMIGMERAEYVLWLGTLPLELFFGAIVLTVLFSGKGVRLGLCIYVMYFFHWLCLHATTLPAPGKIVWQFPREIFTFGNPEASDFWSSGHVANAFIIALATGRSAVWLRVVTWSFLVFQILLVLSARTHYTIDIIGGIFIAYVFHRVSLDLVARWRRVADPQA